MNTQANFGNDRSAAPGILVFGGVTGSGMSTSLKMSFEKVSQPLTTSTVTSALKIVSRFDKPAAKQPSKPFYRNFGKSNRF